MSAKRPPQKGRWAIPSIPSMTHPRLLAQNFQRKKSGPSTVHSAHPRHASAHLDGMLRECGDPTRATPEEAGVMGNILQLHILRSTLARDGEDATSILIPGCTGERQDHCWRIVHGHVQVHARGTSGGTREWKLSVEIASEGREGSGHRAECRTYYMVHLNSSSILCRRSLTSRSLDASLGEVSACSL